MEQTATQIRLLIANPSEIQVDGQPLAMPVLVNRFYQQREFRPAWVEKSGLLVDAAELLEVVKRAENEGLPLQDYRIGSIERYLQGTIENASQLAKLDLLLTDTFLSYSRNVRSGRIGPRRADDDWLLPYTPFDGSALLTQVLKDCSMGEALAALPPRHAGYQRLRSMLYLYRSLAAQGGWPQMSPGETLREGSQGPRVVELRERLRQSGDLRDQSTENPEQFDESLVEAVSRFQRRHGLDPDGSVGKRTLAALNIPVEQRISQIEVNMERWRWLPRELAQSHIQVNMAGYELELYESSMPVLHMRVVVGREKRQTPVFASEVTTIVLNPHWYVPRLIFREDILPALRRDPGRLKRLNMTLLSEGQEVDAGDIDWSSVNGYTFPYTLRQDPGPENALGRIKFLMPNSYGIYLHDTPDRHLFDRTTRAYSSGCIRLEHPLTLAQYLLDNPEQWDHAKLEKVIETGEPQAVRLPEPMPIYFTYWTTWVDQAGTMQFRDDIYQRDRKLLRLWGKNAT